MNANWEEKKWYDGKNEITIPPGSFITSQKHLMESLGLKSRNPIRTSLKHLEKMKMITINSTNKWTQVWIVNWIKYQMPDNSNNQYQHQRPTNDQPTTNQRVDTTKEYKEYKNIRKDIGEEKANFSCPLLRVKALKELFPRGHAECIEYVKDIEKDREHPFLNQAKQYARLHQILEAGYTLTEMNDSIFAMEDKYGVGEWDFDNMANWLEKGAGNAKKTTRRN